MGLVSFFFCTFVAIEMGGVILAFALILFVGLSASVYALVSDL